jgi:predicted nucleic acid-binding protein
MIIVSDTSPLSALITVKQAELLTLIFGEVIIPNAVQAELLRFHTSLPQWLRVQSATDASLVDRHCEVVDRGEAEAIVLAQEIRADYVLIDERRGRRLAREQGLRVIGLLGIVLLAKRRDLIPSARELIEEMIRRSGVYLDEDTKNNALRSVGE